MSRTVSAADANRRFSTILAQAADGGETVIITRRGSPVAQLSPYRPDPDGEDNGRAWGRLLAVLSAGIDLGGEPFDRDALYERASADPCA